MSSWTPFIVGDPGACFRPKIIRSKFAKMFDQRMFGKADTLQQTQSVHSRKTNFIKIEMRSKCDRSLIVFEHLIVHVLESFEKLVGEFQKAKL